VKFWGKIMASKKDYYIAEGISEDAGEQGELPPNVELKGANGINKLSYWVTNDGKFVCFFMGLQIFLSDDWRLGRAAFDNS
jgi:hypothetical protein